MKPGEAIERMAAPEQALPRIDWDFIILDMENRLKQLRERQSRIEAKGRVEQSDVRERILELNRRLTALISDL
ncbi:MAG: hypothetical protein WCJ37_20645 [Syntrophus sp. (in: bacteria)]